MICYYSKKTHVSQPNAIYIYDSVKTYSTRLKTVTLFPTGEKRQVPSGLYSRFP